MSGHNAKKSIKAATGSGSLLVVVVNRGQSEQWSQLKLELLPSLHTYIGVMKSSFGLLLLLFKSNHVLVPTSQILDIIKRIQTWVFKAAYAKPLSDNVSWPNENVKDYVSKSAICCAHQLDQGQEPMLPNIAQDRPCIEQCCSGPISTPQPIVPHHC